MLRTANKLSRNTSSYFKLKYDTARCLYTSSTLSSEELPINEKWKKIATKQMKGKDPEKLLWHTQEGITVKPIYTKEDIDALPSGKYILSLPLKITLIIRIFTYLNNHDLYII